MILCSGCFDGLHAGHVAYLEAVYQLRDMHEPVIVAVASDDYIRVHKRREPTWPQAERMRVVQAVRYVSGVVGHGEMGANVPILDLEPRLFVKGPDWDRRGISTLIVDACRAVGCQLTFVKHDVSAHTSDALSPHQ